MSLFLLQFVDVARTQGEQLTHRAPPAGKRPQSAYALSLVEMVTGRRQGSKQCPGCESWTLCKRLVLESRVSVRGGGSLLTRSTIVPQNMPLSELPRQCETHIGKSSDLKETTMYNFSMQFLQHLVRPLSVL